MKRSILILGFVMFLLMVNSEVFITNTEVEGNGVDVTLTFRDTATPDKRANISVSITADEMYNTKDLPIACFPNDVDNVIPEGTTVDGFTMLYVPDQSPTSATDQIYLVFMPSNITMNANGKFDYDHGDSAYQKIFQIVLGPMEFFHTL